MTEAKKGDFADFMIWGSSKRGFSIHDPHSVEQTEVDDLPGLIRYLSEIDRDFSNLDVRIDMPLGNRNRMIIEAVLDGYRHRDQRAVIILPMGEIL